MGTFNSTLLEPGFVFRILDLVAGSLRRRPNFVQVFVLTRAEEIPSTSIASDSSSAADNASRSSGWLGGQVTS